MLSSLSKQYLTKPVLAQTELAEINASLERRLLVLEGSDSAIEIGADEIEHLIMLIKRLPVLIEKEPVSHKALCKILLEMLEFMFERPSSELRDNLFRKLATDVGPILLDALVQQKTKYSSLLRRFAEAFSVLVGSICSRVAFSKLRLLQHAHFLLSNDQSCFIIGKFIGECGSFLVQANIMEALLKLLHKLHQVKMMSRMKILCSRICNGVLSCQNAESNHVLHLSNMLISIVESMDMNLETFVQRIRCWVNIANDIRSKFAMSTVSSFLSKKLLLETKDTQIPVWVDFNQKEITMTGLPNDNVHAYPIALALEYTNINEAIGNRGSSAVTFRITKIDDLWEGVEKSLELVVIEFSRSDFRSVLDHILKHNVKLKLAKPPSSLSALKKDKLPSGHIVPIRKASITYSTEILERFFNMNHGTEAKSKCMPLDAQKNSGGLPACQGNAKFPKRAREFIASSTALGPKQPPDFEYDAHDLDPENKLLSEVYKKRKYWERNVTSFREEHARIQREYIEATTKLIEEFTDSCQKVMIGFEQGLRCSSPK